MENLFHIQLWYKRRRCRENSASDACLLLRWPSRRVVCKFYVKNMSINKYVQYRGNEYRYRYCGVSLCACNDASFYEISLVLIWSGINVRWFFIHHSSVSQIVELRKRTRDGSERPSLLALMEAKDHHCSPSIRPTRLLVICYKWHLHHGFVSLFSVQSESQIIRTN